MSVEACVNEKAITLRRCQSILQDNQQRVSTTKMYRSDSICDSEQRLLHTHVRDMDDAVVPGKSISASSLLADRGPIFSLVVGDGVDVELVRRLRQ